MPSRSAKLAYVADAIPAALLGVAVVFLSVSYATLVSAPRVCDSPVIIDASVASSSQRGIISRSQRTRYEAESSLFHESHLELCEQRRGSVPLGRAVPNPAS